MKTKKKKIQISAAVAHAISNLLFDSEGIDMSPIVNALSANETRERESVAITTALLMKGVKLEPSTQVRYALEKSEYSSEPAICVREYTYNGYAPYDDKVYYTAKIVYSKPQEGKEEKDLRSYYKVGYTNESNMTEDSWESLLEFDELPKEIQDAINGEKAFNDMCKIVDPE